MMSAISNRHAVSKSGQPLSEYQHEPLKSERHIKVLRFQQSSSNGPIRFTLRHISLDRVTSKSSPYNAVSYTWASDLPDVDVLCNGQRLRVTGNCEAALRRFWNRRIGDPAKNALWIDSICICQNDIKERNHQVSITAEIYEKARCVLIWLGPSTRDTEYVFKHYRHTYSWSSYFWGLLYTLHIYTLKSPEGDLGRINSMLAVSNIPWFSRVWTVQEVAFAREPIAFCGRDTARFRYLSTILLSSLGKTFGSSGTILGHKTQQIWFRYVRASSVSNIRELLHNMAVIASSQATEPRDKIFAIRGLLKKLGVSLPLPDYAASLTDVYWQATKVFLLEYPEILYLVTGFPSPHLEDAPSWVPDYSDESFRFASPAWDIFNRSIVNGIPKTSRQRVACPGPSGRLLQLEGRIFDVICNVSKLMMWDTESFQPSHEFELLGILEPHSHRIIDTLQDWAFMARRTALYVNGQSWQEAFLVTICSRSTSFQKRFQPLASDAKEWCSILLLDDAGAGLHVLDNQWPLTASRIQHSVPPILFRSATVAIQNGISQEYISLLLAIYLHNMTSEILLSLSDNIFFITEKGYMGIGPSSIKEGDKVLCIPGLDLPLMVRPVGERFTLVSAAYVHGIPETISSDTEPLSTFILE